VPFYYWLHEEPHDYYRYTEHGLRFLIEGAGLGVAVLEPVGGAAEVLADVAGKHLAFVPAVGGAAARLLGRACYAVSRVPLAGRALAVSRRRFPLGYFVVAEKKR
jgi:hypothetical protein